MNPHSPIKTRNQRRAAAQAQRSADHNNALTQEFNKAMTDLVFVAKGTDFPIQGCCMKKMQCIEYNAKSDYVKRNPAAKPKDNWWSHLTFEHDFKGQTVSNNTLAVFGCYLDVHERTKGKLKDWQERTQWCKHMSQHLSQHIEQWQERTRWCKDVSQHNEQWQERTRWCEHVSHHNEHPEVRARQSSQ